MTGSLFGGDFTRRQTPAAATPKPMVPLASAAWHVGETSAVGRHRDGDFWLGFNAESQPIGMRDNRHVMVIAGNRGGKGVSVIAPNLGLWKGSAFVLDPKGENAMIMARRRANGSKYCKGLGQRTQILDPCGIVRTDEDDFVDLKAAFNPLDMLDPAKPESIDLAAKIADALLPTPNAGDPFWTESARSLVRDLMLHLVSSVAIPRDKRNLGTLRDLLIAGSEASSKIAALFGVKDGVSGHELLFQDMQRNAAFGGVVRRAGVMLAAMAEDSPRTFQNVLQVAVSGTQFLDSPGVRECLAHSTFKLADLKRDRRGLSIFVCLPFGYATTHAGLLRMMATLTLSEMEREAGPSANGAPLLMVLDELPSLGRMPVIENAAAQMAGFGVRMMFVAQTLAQLKDLYKDNWETFVANAGTKIFFCNDDHFTRDYVSKLIGEREIVRTTRTASGTDSWTKGTSTSFSHSETVGVSRNWSSGGGPLGNSGWSKSHSATSGATRSTSESQSGSHTQGASETLHKRPLLTPDEVGRTFGDLDNPMMLTLVSGYQPMALKRVRYYAWEWFGGRYDPHPRHPKPLTLVKLEDKRRRDREDKDRRDAEAKARKESERIEKERRAAFDVEYKAMCIRRDRQFRIEEIVIRCIKVGFTGVATLAGSGFVLWYYGML